MPTLTRLVYDAASPFHRAIVIPPSTPDNPVVRVLTYADLAAASAALAAQLSPLLHQRHPSPTPGQCHVAWALPNSAAFVALFFAVTASCAVAVPLNPVYSKKEFTYYLNDTQPAALVLPEETLLLSASAGKFAPAVEAANELGIPVVRIREEWTSGVCTLSLHHSRATNHPASLPPTPVPDNIALVLHTSGTTSAPKPVPLTHANLHASAHAIAHSTYRLSPSDISLCVMPLFHVHGLIGCVLATLISGGTIVLPVKFSAANHWDWVRRHGVTWFTAVPTIHAILTTLPPPSPAPETLRFIRSCSSSLAPVLYRKLQRHYNVPGLPILEAYAMTEASHQMTSTPLHGPHHPGTVGIPHGTVRISIRDDSGRLLPDGTQGEVCVISASVTHGYLHTQANRTAFFPNGNARWFRTGDRGYIDPTRHHHLVLTGRIKELINHKGEKISPVEIDAMVLEAPGVRDAVVFAVEDDIAGEVPAAAVVLSQTAASDAPLDRVVQHLATTLAPYKVPRRWYLLADIPKTATGKVQRRIVKEYCLAHPDAQVQVSMPGIKARL